MDVETFETNRLEKIAHDELSSVHEVAPLVVSNENIGAEAAEVVADETEAPCELAESLESFEKKRNEKLEILYDSEVTERIADYLTSLKELRYENWTKLSLEQRQKLLNKIERRIAAIEHRPPLPIAVEQMEASTFGYQNTYFHKIALNSMYVGSDSKNDYFEVIDTIIHEGRHAYQHYNVDKKLIHESASVVNTWRENFYDPKYQYYNDESCIIPILS